MNSWCLEILYLIRVGVALKRDKATKWLKVAEIYHNSILWSDESSLIPLTPFGFGFDYTLLFCFFILNPLKSQISRVIEAFTVEPYKCIASCIDSRCVDRHLGDESDVANISHSTSVYLKILIKAKLFLELW